MEHDPQAPETQKCGDRPRDETTLSATTTRPDEMEAFVVLFIATSIAGLAALVVYGVVSGAGSPARTVHAILANLWMPGAFALTFTLTAAAATRGSRFLKRRLRQVLFKHPWE